MGLKMEFVKRVSQGEAVAALCREYGVSRPTGHKWVKRYAQLGVDGLEERSRRPKTAPLTTAEDIVLAVLTEREQHPTWGQRLLCSYWRDGLASSLRVSARLLGFLDAQEWFRSESAGGWSMLSIVHRTSMRTAPMTFGLWTSKVGGER